MGWNVNLRKGVVSIIQYSECQPYLFLEKNMHGEELALSLTTSDKDNTKGDDDQVEFILLMEKFRRRKRLSAGLHHSAFGIPVVNRKEKKNTMIHIFFC